MEGKLIHGRWEFAECNIPDQYPSKTKNYWEFSSNGVFESYVGTRSIVRTTYELDGEILWIDFTQYYSDLLSDNYADDLYRIICLTQNRLVVSHIDATTGIELRFTFNKITPITDPPHIA